MTTTAIMSRALSAHPGICAPPWWRPPSSTAAAYTGKRWALSDASAGSMWRHVQSIAGVCVALASRRIVNQRRIQQSVQRRAVVEGDPDSSAVRRWLETVIVGLGFCPWARPAQDEGHIRLVSSTAETEDEVLADLADEAKALIKTPAVPSSGEVTTTLLVCPSVRAWDDFETFRNFFSEELLNGYALSDELGLKVVAFHPAYERHELELNSGDVVALAGPGGITAVGTILDAHAGTDDGGQKLLEIQLEEGEEDEDEDDHEADEYEYDDSDIVDGAEMEEEQSSVLVGSSTVVKVISRASDQPVKASGGSGSDDPSSLVMRAPRPVLHLLRECDLDRAGEVEGVEEAVLAQNRKRVVEIGGAQRIAELLRTCEDIRR